MSTSAEPSLSIVHGIPLADEPSLGPLTLPGYLRDVTTRYASNEAVVMHNPDGSVTRWSYAELWDRSMEVARALVACGVGKDMRVGVMMTNRPEWIAAFFGVGLAGGVAATLSTFSTLPELEVLLQASGASIVLYEASVLKKDFSALLTELEPGIVDATPGELVSHRFPFLRRLVAVGALPSKPGAIESWSDFLKHGETVSPELVEAMADSVKPADAGVMFFSSGTTGKPKGILSAHRGVALQCWRWKRFFATGDNVRCWTANGFFWSGNFGMALGGTFSSGGALILQPTFEPAEALRLMEAERVTMPIAWPHQRAQLEGAPNWLDVDLSSFHYIDPGWNLARHPTVHAAWDEPAQAYGNTETFTISAIFESGTPPEIRVNSHGRALPGNTIKIVDPMTGETVSRGERGEIAVKGPTLMLGYTGIPLDETLDSEGFFRCGDGGYIDDQDRLYWEGRLNDIIKTGGANVSPIEVDAVLAVCPGVKRCQTVGIPDEMLGELVVTCVVPHEDANPTEESVRAYAKERLASYKIPRRVLLVRDDELSQTGSAKVKTQELREFVAKRFAAEQGGTR